MSGQTGPAAARIHRNGWPTAVASLAVGVAFFALWFWPLPGWLGFSVDTAGAARWRWLAAVAIGTNEKPNVRQGNTCFASVNRFRQSGCKEGSSSR